MGITSSAPVQTHVRKACTKLAKNMEERCVKYEKYEGFIPSAHDLVDYYPPRNSPRIKIKNGVGRRIDHEDLYVDKESLWEKVTSVFKPRKTYGGRRKTRKRKQKY